MLGDATFCSSTYYPKRQVGSGVGGVIHLVGLYCRHNRYWKHRDLDILGWLPSQPFGLTAGGRSQNERCAYTVPVTVAGHKEIRMS
jgi:hypothetical protein